MQDQGSWDEWGNYDPPAPKTCGWGRFLTTLVLAFWIGATAYTAWLWWTLQF